MNHYLGIFLIYPYFRQVILDSIFTFGLIWVMVRVFSFKEARLQAAVYSAPLLVPVLLPFIPDSRLYWGPFMLIQNLHWGQFTEFKWLVTVCYLPFIVAVLQLLISYLAYRRMLSGCREVTVENAPQLFAHLDPLVRKTGIAKLQVYILPPERGVQIFVSGIRRPLLVISPLLLSALSDSELQAVLAHELAHLVRRDQIASMVTFLLRSLMFYNPLLYPLVKWLKEEREKAADALATRWTKKPFALAGGLVKVTKLMLEQRPLYTSYGLSTIELTSGGALRERVRLLLDQTNEPRKEMPKRIWFFLGLLFTLEIAFAHWALLPLNQHFSCVLWQFH
ncbi:antirepressor regulating drug resistance protein [Desulfosporosinus acidiphilus SJ4]|uniref:Antirepressor regulating drug resistance protein n=1 Tax=Desulfosporosinus acidiphilus (strain DSM 22704 / JCM 16185 / SJ4) TaxID=646529 RepID=I4D1G1_DESAJ|nr:M56 family metallopeptidase [Desulfosporosinus acidiphilus]AFM39635.1 antirepressor regulating drug resistance protein [Desulfosporosinus acidiphilus SJ4]